MVQAIVAYTWAVGAYPLVRKGVTPMETFQALQLMFLFGMFILALLTFIQKMK
ncbi:putative holin-like toxin [Paenibacillus larvae]|uniref:putative holin-like toxin n=1 Tax=Paenibacillus larvae TaxID=1464 RepID=UPI0009B6F40D